MSDINATAVAVSGHRPMGFPEFVIVIASIMALNPLAMDMMLPALPNIASAFHITSVNRPQMVLSIFLVGFGVGQFVMGPLSDRFGRRPVLLGGMALYCVASLLAVAAPSFSRGSDDDAPRSAYSLRRLGHLSSASRHGRRGHLHDIGR